MLSVACNPALGARQKADAVSGQTDTSNCEAKT
jgi:hypothetical protein